MHVSLLARESKLIIKLALDIQLCTAIYKHKYNAITRDGNQSSLR